MRAVLLFREKTTAPGGGLIEMVIWRVPVDSRHPEGLRYRLAFVPGRSGDPAVLYDNHHPKGHHRHRNGVESGYAFVDTKTLIEDFKRDIVLWRTDEKRRHEDGGV